MNDFKIKPVHNKNNIARNIAKKMTVLGAASVISCSPVFGPVVGLPVYHLSKSDIVKIVDNRLYSEFGFSMEHDKDVTISGESGDIHFDADGAHDDQKIYYEITGIKDYDSLPDAQKLSSSETGIIADCQYGDSYLLVIDSTEDYIVYSKLDHFIDVLNQSL